MDGNLPRPISAAGAWMRALRGITALAAAGAPTLTDRLDELAERHGARPALCSETATLSYAELPAQRNRIARWAAAQGIGRGSRVGLLMANSAHYPAIWLGIQAAGGTVALLNPQLAGRALLHACRSSEISDLITDAEHLPMAGSLLASEPGLVRLWCVDRAGPPENWIDWARYASEPLPERPIMGARDAALLIFTSGTTGLPKAARITHARILEWGGWFAGMMNATEADRLYDCLPLYHSTGGVVGIAAMLLSGGTVVIRQRFSARQTWRDIESERCTIFLYIGELCRYLLQAPSDPAESRHGLRLCCGNGLRADVWRRFQTRFGIPQILEFYASTEGNLSLYNVEGQPGAIGRVPGFLAHRFSVVLIACDAETGEWERDGEGRPRRASVDEPGEAIARIGEGAAAFDGYTDPEATRRKIACDVFVPGDAWFRTGDLMRRDRAGFYYFIDRLGETFRWKGENVSAAEVADAVGSCPGVTGAAVFGVAVPGHEGRAGMAAITTQAGFDAAKLHAHLAASLPAYARPIFLRLCRALDRTGTFKTVTGRLAREGFAPNQAGEPVYWADPARSCFRLFDDETRAALAEGRIRL